MRGSPPYPQSSHMSAWRHCSAASSLARSRRADFAARNRLKWSSNERPVRGDNRTGQAIWALGVDGRSRRIQPRWGGVNAPTPILSARRRRTFKPPPIFLGLLAGTFGDYRAAVGRVEVAPPDHAAYASGWSEAR